MKKYLVLTLILMTLACAGPSYAQNAPGGASAPAPGGMTDALFAQHRDALVMRMNQHIAETQRRIACVQVAVNQEGIKECMVKDRPQQIPGQRQ